MAENLRRRGRRTTDFFGAPLASPSLALTLGFEWNNSNTRSTSSCTSSFSPPSQQAHEDAVQRAAAHVLLGGCLDNDSKQQSSSSSLLLLSSMFRARRYSLNNNDNKEEESPSTTLKSLSVESVHHAPFDTDFHRHPAADNDDDEKDDEDVTTTTTTTTNDKDGSFDKDNKAGSTAVVRYEFWYNGPQLFLRIVTSWGGDERKRSTSINTKEKEYQKDYVQEQQQQKHQQNQRQQQDDLLLSSFCFIDGVTAVRIGLHALELLVAGELSKSAFPVTTTSFSFGWRQWFNYVREIPMTLPVMLYSYLKYRCVKWIRLQHNFIYHRILSLLDSTRPTTTTTTQKSEPVNSIYSMIRFYDSLGDNNQNNNNKVSAHFQLYHIDPKQNHSVSAGMAFDAFLQSVHDWRHTLGLRGYYYLINCSPWISAGTTPYLSDLISLQKRWQRAYRRIGPPPTHRDDWKVLNSQMVSLLYMNNYGRHVHPVLAAAQLRPTAFLWDWLDLAPCLHGTGCIAINGHFLAWFRGMNATTTTSSTMGDLPSVTFEQRLHEKHQQQEQQQRQKQEITSNQAMCSTNDDDNDTISSFFQPVATVEQNLAWSSPSS